MAQATDSVLVPELGFGISEYVEVGLRYADLAIRALASSWPDGDVPTEGPARLTDQELAAPEVLLSMPVEAMVAPSETLRAALNWATATRSLHWPNSASDSATSDGAANAAGTRRGRQGQALRSRSDPGHRALPAQNRYPRPARPALRRHRKHPHPRYPGSAAPPRRVWPRGPAVNSQIPHTRRRRCPPRQVRQSAAKEDQTSMLILCAPLDSGWCRKTQSRAECVLPTPARPSTPRPATCGHVQAVPERDEHQAGGELHHREPRKDQATGA